MATFNLNGEGTDVLNVLADVCPDTHICGFCKQQYNNFELFLAHKQNGCQITQQIPAQIPPATATAPGPGVAVEGSFQACVTKVLKRPLGAKTQRSPSKRSKPTGPSARRSCCFSGCTFKTQYGQKDMERHLKTHTGEKPYECELCNKRFSRRDKLNMHSRCHTGERPHKCHYCNYAAADTSSLKKHLRIHGDERPFRCQICPYASRNSSQLTVHLRSHTGDCPFQCSQCDAKFKINSDLKRHVRVHSGEKPFACHLCDYRAAMKGNLKSHVRIKHAAHNAFHCPHCDFTCASKSALRQHARAHLPPLPLQCPKCSYSCASRGALKTHERVHSDERPFRCERCPFSSKQRSNLLIHLKKCHVTGDTPTGRRTAGRPRPRHSLEGGGDSSQPISSRYRARLEAVRRFSCEVCDATFVREDSLRCHRRQHQNQDGVLQLPASTASPQAPPTATASSPSSNPELPSQLQDSPLLKIIVTPPLGQERADALISPVQVSLLPLPNLAPPTEGGLEQPTLLFTHLPSDAPPPTCGPPTCLTQTLRPSICPPSLSSSPDPPSPTFIATCTDLDGLTALIREGGTEVTVVTDTEHSDFPSATQCCPLEVVSGDVFCGEDDSKQLEVRHLLDGDGGAPSAQDILGSLAAPDSGTSEHIVGGPKSSEDSRVPMLPPVELEDPNDPLLMSSAPPPFQTPPHHILSHTQPIPSEH